MKVKTRLTILGFVLFMIGFLSIVLSTVGLDLTILKFLDAFGRGASFSIKLLMLFGGMILFYVARTLEIDGEFEE
jgi:hypothetical protein